MFTFAFISGFSFHLTTFPFLEVSITPYGKFVLNSFKLIVTNDFFVTCCFIIFFKLKLKIESPYIHTKSSSINSSAVLSCPAVANGLFEIAYSILTPNLLPSSK